MLILKAKENGWRYVKANHVPRSFDSVLVDSWLKDALLRLNPITDDQAEQVIYKLRSAIMSGNHPDSLVEANDRFRKLLFEENSYPFGDNGDNVNITFLSTNSEQNDCVVTNQWEFPRQSVEGGAGC